MKLLILSSLLSIVLCDICITTPPTLWCESKDLAKKCGWATACDSYFSATYNKPVLLTLLYESLCPGCQAFITEQLYPKIFKKFPKEVVTIELVPYGNAKIKDGVIVCQHGEEECRINKFESCLIDSMQTPDQFVPMIHCLETQLKVGIDFEKASNKCFRTLAVDDGIIRMVQSCQVSKLSTNLQMKAAERTDNVEPEKHDHVPWMLFNNVSIGSAQGILDDIPAAICQWYRGDLYQKVCQIEKKYRQFSYKLN